MFKNIDKTLIFKLQLQNAPSGSSSGQTIQFFINQQQQKIELWFKIQLSVFFLIYLNQFFMADQDKADQKKKHNKAYAKIQQTLQDSSLRTQQILQQSKKVTHEKCQDVCVKKFIMALLIITLVSVFCLSILQHSKTLQSLKNKQNGAISQVQKKLSFLIEEAQSILKADATQAQSLRDYVMKLKEISKQGVEQQQKIASQIHKIQQLQQQFLRKIFSTDKFDYWGSPRREGDIRVPKNMRGHPDNFNSSSTPVDIQYQEGQYFPLPPYFLREKKDQYNKTISIADALYPNQKTREERKQFHQARLKFFKDNRGAYNSQIHLAKYNTAFTKSEWDLGQIDNKIDWIRLNNKYNLQKIQKQLPFCLIVPGYNNNANFRIQHNLNSIFSQNYTNYFVVIIDDHSSDESIQIYRRYFAFHRIDKSKYLLLENKQRETALPNIYINSMKYCSLEAIGLTVDGDDQLIGRNVLQIFNWAHQTQKAGVIYSNFIAFNHTYINKGYTLPYTEEERMYNKYRDVKIKVSLPRSYRNELMFLIDPSLLQSQNGNFYKVTYDQAIFFPLMELSCGRVYKIEDQFDYLYSVGTNLNDYLNPQQKLIALEVRKKPRMSCDKDFEERMKSFNPIISKEPSTHENLNLVVYIDYFGGKENALPIDFLRKDSEGNTIQKVLYDAELQKQRQKFQMQRESFLDQRSNITQAFLARYNNAFDEKHKNEGIYTNMKDWQRLNAKFGLQTIKTQIPMCIVSTGYNNNANFRIQYNLNSIFSQNYTNYKLVLINDNSYDGSDIIYRKYFAFHRISKSRYTYIQNKKRITALENIYFASMNHCPFDSVVVTLDADDEFIGRNVLQVFNWGYQTKKAGVLYSNFFVHFLGRSLRKGFTSEYSIQEKQNNLYRDVKAKFSQLRTFRNELIFQIDQRDLKDENGAFYTIDYDLALFFPLMQLSCGRVFKIQGQINYLYNIQTGFNDYKQKQKQQRIEKEIRSKRKLNCSKDFENRMK